jgi:hypothetical protein
MGARIAPRHVYGGPVMSKPSTSFQLGDVITGEPHLYIANPAPSSSDSPAAAIEPAQTSLFNRFFAALRRTFRLGPTPDDSLARALDRAFTP